MTNTETMVLDDLAEDRADAGLDTDPTPPKEGRGNYRIRLANLEDVRVEMAKVYRETRRGAIDVKLGNALFYQLGTLQKATQAAAEIENAERIKRLEDLLNSMRGEHG